ARMVGELPRHHRRAVRQLPHAARHPNAARAREPARRERHRGGRRAARSRRRGARLLSWTPDASRPRDRGGAAARVRRNGQFRGYRRCGWSRAPYVGAGGLHARRVVGRGREPHRSSGHHDPCVDGRFGTCNRRDPRLARPVVRRHRIRRRPGARPHERPRLCRCRIWKLYHARGGDRMSETNVVLLGIGAIGRELLSQLETNYRTSRRLIRVCGLVDRSGYVFEPSGLSWRRVMELRALKEAGTSIAQSEGGTACLPETSVATLTARLPRRSILVDATAADTQPILEAAPYTRIDLVLSQ